MLKCGILKSAGLKVAIMKLDPYLNFDPGTMSPYQHGEVFVTNDKVIKMHEKYGFRREAFYREHCVRNKQKLDVVGLDILKSNYFQSFQWIILRLNRKF